MSKKEKAVSAPGEKPEYVKLKLKTLIRTDEAYLVDLGQGKVWIPKEDIKSTRRLDQKVLEIEVREDIIEEKRRDLRRLKEQLTGIKGSVRGEVVEFIGERVGETKDSYLIDLGDKKVHISKVCFAEMEKLPGGKYRFVIQKDYLEFKLRRLELPDTSSEHTTVSVGLVQETDRAYLFEYQGLQVWYPKREVVKIKPSGKEWEITVPTDFWLFKLEQG